MSSHNSDVQLKLDPWAASSLLQKAIRRGEAGLARQAARLLYRYRGSIVWRRLATIAVEDIGIADLDLVSEVIHLFTDKQLRDVLGSDTDLLDDICGRLAACPKERGADYLMCAATKLPAALHERQEMLHLGRPGLIAAAANLELPLPCRATAALLSCTVSGKQDRLAREPLSRLLDALDAPPNLATALMSLVGRRAEPFVLMLPILWSCWRWCGGAFELTAEEIPKPEFLGPVPLYTFDFHTAVGKRAIARLAKDEPQVRTALTRHTPPHRHLPVAEVAAFYADASPVTLRFVWTGGNLLSQLGGYADMLAAGCRLEGVLEVVQAVKQGLPALNSFRRQALRRPGFAECN